MQNPKPKLTKDAEALELWRAFTDLGEDPESNVEFMIGAVAEVMQKHDQDCSFQIRFFPGLAPVLF